MREPNAPRLADPVVLVCLMLSIAVQLPDGIRFGDGLEFVAVSSHLGVAHPPGYPLFTLLGWIALSVLPCDPYNAVLWMCKFAAFAGAAGLYYWLRHLLARMGVAPMRCVLGAGLTAAIFTFSGPMWPTQHLVEAYGLNAAFLVWISYLLARATQEGGPTGRSLVLAGLLLGLALGNHITSGCLLPALLIVAWRAKRITGWVAPTLALSLVVIVPALLYGSLILRVPSNDVAGIAWGSTVDIASLIHHMRGGDYGGRLLLMQDVNTPFTFTTWLSFAWERTLLVLHILGQILLVQAAWFAAIPLAALAVFGLFARASNGRRAVSVGVIIAVLLQLGFVFTFNVPDIHDHVLGVIVLAVPFTVAGAVSLSNFRKLAAVRRLGSLGMSAVLGVTLVVAVIANAPAAFPEGHDIAPRWRDRLLKQVPEGSALITVDDSDLFALWYTQMACGERTDIAVFGGNFVGCPWFRQSMPPGDRRRGVVGFRERPFGTLDEYISDLRDHVIEPFFATGSRVFTTMHREIERTALGKVYDLRFVSNLLTPDEFKVLKKRAQGRMYHGAPVLFEVLEKH
jgi:hypothetical protein